MYFLIFDSRILFECYERSFGNLFQVKLWLYVFVPWNLYKLYSSITDKISIFFENLEPNIIKLIISF